MILSSEGITKALISLRDCAGWSAPLLVAKPEDRFCRVKAVLSAVLSASPFNSACWVIFYAFVVVILICVQTVCKVYQRRQKLPPARTV